MGFGAAALLASRAKAGGPGRTRTCNQTVMSGRIKDAAVDSTAFSCGMDRVRRGLTASFLVQNWCGPSEIIGLKLWIVATVRRAKVAAMPRRSQRSVLAQSLLSARRGVRSQSRQALECPAQRASQSDVPQSKRTSAHLWIHEFTPFDARVELDQPRMMRCIMGWPA